MRRATGVQELLDGPLDERLLAANLRDLARANGWLGGTELSWRAILRATPPPPWPRPIRVLDVGTGAADIPVSLLRRATTTGMQLQVVGVDVRQEIVDLARRRTSGIANLYVELAPDGALAFGESSFDIVHASLVLHHLDPDPAQRLLSEMARVCRQAVVVNDLARARRWWLGAWLLTRVATLNRYTRHDAPLSVRRAYTPTEVAALAGHTGLREVARLTAGFGHRYAVVFEKRQKAALGRDE